MAGSSHDSDDIIAGINVTPLVDIVLVLLITFMVTANFIAQRSIKVDLPKSETGESAKPSPLALTLTKTGTLLLNGKVSDRNKIKLYINAKFANPEEAEAIIAADEDVSHGNVVSMIDFVRKLGIERFAISVSGISVDVENK